MAAVVRGKAKAAARGRSNSAKPARSRAKSGRPATYAPGKLGSADVLPPRVAVACAVVVVCVGLIAALVTGDRPHRLGLAMRGGAADNMAGLGFKLRRVHIQGAPDMAKADILHAAGLYKDQPILGLDLNDVRARVEAVGWVKQAQVVRLLPDTLVLAVIPRPTLAVWQHGNQLQVIDDEGRVIIEANPSNFSALPLVVGAGANEAAGAVLPILRTRPHLMERLEALVRVDGRRWDLRLKDGSLIQLPAVGEDSALIQLDQLDQRSRLLELGFDRIDLRDAETIAVRPRREAALSSSVMVGG